MPLGILYLKRDLKLAFAFYLITRATKRENIFVYMMGKSQTERPKANQLRDAARTKTNGRNGMLVVDFVRITVPAYIFWRLKSKRYFLVLHAAVIYKTNRCKWACVHHYVEECGQVANRRGADSKEKRQPHYI